MSESRALKFAGLGAVLVGAALWFAPPPQIIALLGQEPENQTPAAGQGATPSPAPQPAESTTVNPLETMKVEDLEDIVQRPLFNPDRAAAQAEPPPEPAVPEEPPPQPPAPEVTAANFALLAVAGGEQSRVALVRDNTSSKVYHVRAGQYVADWKVAALSDRDVSLERDGNTVSLKLFEGTSRPPPPAPADGAGDSGGDPANDAGDAGNDAAGVPDQPVDGNVDNGNSNEDPNAAPQGDQPPPVDAVNDPNLNMN